MRAVRILAPGEATVAEVSPPAVADGEQLVTVVSAAICTTDRKMTQRGVPLGRTLGHEVVGRLADGTPVGVHPDTGCGRCEQCAVGQTNRCAHIESIGIKRDGGFAGYVSAPRAHLVGLEGIDLRYAPLLEPFACCVHAVRAVGPISGPAVVVGAGAMGIFLMWALQAQGHEVAISQATEDRRQQALNLGAQFVMTPQEDPTAVLGRAPGAIFVTAPGSEALTWALERVAVGGAVHAFAGTPGGSLVDANLVHYRHLRLVGTTGSGVVDYRTARDLVAAGKVDLTRLPHRRISLSQAPQALAESGELQDLRVLIDISDADR